LEAACAVRPPHISIYDLQVMYSWLVAKGKAADVQQYVKCVYVAVCVCFLLYQQC
jgi:hypothetical protein